MESIEGLPRQLKTYHIAGYSLLCETVQDDDALLDIYAQSHPSSTEAIPYYATLWPSALGLCEFLAKEHPVLQGLDVIELGCGLGLPSILAHKLGAKRVIGTDFHPDAKMFFLRNATLNATPVGFKALAWENPPPALTADLLLGSDLLYESERASSLVSCIRQLLRPGGIVVLSDPGRAHIQDAVTRLEASGLQQTRFDVFNDTFVVEFRATKSP